MKLNLSLPLILAAIVWTSRLDLARAQPPATKATTAQADAATTTESSDASAEEGAQDKTEDEKEDDGKLEGYTTAIDPLLVRVKPAVYAGAMKIDSVAAHGSRVSAGQSVLTLDRTEIEDAIAGAATDLELARATQAKAEADIKLGTEGEALEMTKAVDSVADAEKAIQWFEKVDGPHQVKELELGLKQVADSVGDQTDELDQLRKMYQSEQLTNATADIVVKRAVRQLENLKTSQTMTLEQAEKSRQTDFINKREEVDRALSDAQHALAELKSAHELARVTRENALVKARLAYRQAERQLNDLEKDKQALTVTSPLEGTVLFGRLESGAWQDNAADKLKPGESVEAGAVVMMVAPSGKIRITAKVSEANRSKWSAGQVVSIVPTALPDVSLSGRFLEPPITPDASGMYEWPIELTGTDGRLVPGMSVKISK